MPCFHVAIGGGDMGTAITVSRLSYIEVKQRRAEAQDCLLLKSVPSAPRQRKLKRGLFFFCDMTKGVDLCQRACYD